MQQRTTGYATSTGIRLLELLVERHGEVFAASEAVEAGRSLGISRSHAYKLLHDLTRSAFLRRLPKGLYVVASSLAGGVEPHSFAIATHLVRPSAISHWSALHHWGLVEQVPFVVTASTPKSVVTPDMRHKAADPPARAREHAAWVVDGVRYEFTRIGPQNMFGIDQVWIDARTQVPMFDKERALLDAFVQLGGFGAGGLGDQVLAGHRDEIDLEKLVRYAEEMDRPGAIARVRSALNRAGAATGRNWG